MNDNCGTSRGHYLFSFIFQIAVNSNHFAMRPMFLNPMVLNWKFELLQVTGQWCESERTWTSIEHVSWFNVGGTVQVREWNPRESCGTLAVDNMDVIGCLCVHFAFFRCLNSAFQLADMLTYIWALEVQDLPSHTDVNLCNTHLNRSMKAAGSICLRILYTVSDAAENWEQCQDRFLHIQPCVPWMGQFIACQSLLFSKFTFRIVRSFKFPSARICPF